MRRAVPLYVGRPVFDGHESGRPERPPSQMVARIEKPRYREGAGGPEIRGNLRVVKSHSLGRALLEAASDPAREGFYALSHSAEAGNYDFENGVQVITEIACVHSVDLVCDAATNATLFESAGLSFAAEPPLGYGLYGTFASSVPFFHNWSSPIANTTTRVRLSDALDALSRQPGIALRERRACLRLAEAAEEDEGDVPNPYGNAVNPSDLEQGYVHQASQIIVKMFDGRLSQKEALAELKKLHDNYEALGAAMGGDPEQAEESHRKAVTSFLRGGGDFPASRLAEGRDRLRFDEGEAGQRRRLQFLRG